MQEDITIVDNREGKRYEARIGGELVGFAEYQLTPTLIVFTHTEVDSKCEGMGIGSALARFALDDTRNQGMRQVLPLCPFIKAWIARHPAYIDMVFSRPATTAKD